MLKEQRLALEADVSGSPHSCVPAMSFWMIVLLVPLRLMKTPKYLAVVAFVPPVSPPSAQDCFTSLASSSSVFSSIVSSAMSSTKVRRVDRFAFVVYCLIRPARSHLLHRDDCIVVRCTECRFLCCLSPCLVPVPALQTGHVPSQSLSVSVALLCRSSNTLLTIPGTLFLNACTMVLCSGLGKAALASRKL